MIEEDMQPSEKPVPVQWMCEKCGYSDDEYDVVVDHMMEEHQ